jgi:Putative peptidoglycan binding domain
MTKAILVLSSTLALLAACSQTTPAPNVAPEQTFTPIRQEPVNASIGSSAASATSIHHNAFMFQVQERLKKLGYYEGEVDGANGPKTKAAVAHFQRDNNLKVTGAVDQHTDSALKLSSGK